MGVTNHPLIGQRVRLTGEDWPRSLAGALLPVVRVDEIDGTVMSRSPQGRGFWAWINDPEHPFAGEIVRTIYGSRPRNVDPLPYVDGHTNAAGDGRRFAEPYHVDGDGTDCPWCVTRYAPRPGYDPAPIHPVNPILAHFRYVAGAVHAVSTAQWMVRSNAFDEPGDAPLSRDPYTDEHLEHARRVIERLARL